MSFWVYILQCRDGSYYTGQTDNLECRMAQHDQASLPGYTKNRRPVQLVFTQAFATRLEALTAERQIKGWSRLKKEALIKKDWETLKKLSKGKINL